jgi:hypothetical protein
VGRGILEWQETLGILGILEMVELEAQQAISRLILIAVGHIKQAALVALLGS